MGVEKVERQSLRAFTCEGTRAWTAFINNMSGTENLDIGNELCNLAVF